MKNRFLKLCFFKCNVYRYTGGETWEALDAAAGAAAPEMNAQDVSNAMYAVGLYKLNPVDP
jgi:hypothetical protein